MVGAATAYLSSDGTVLGASRGPAVIFRRIQSWSPSGTGTADLYLVEHPPYPSPSRVTTSLSGHHQPLEPCQL